MSTDKVDYETGVLDEDVLPSMLRSRWRQPGCLKLAGLFSFTLLVQYLWLMTFPYPGRGVQDIPTVPSRLQPELAMSSYNHGSGGTTHDISPDERCPQPEILTTPEHVDLLDILDKEFSTPAFKRKAYESLGGAVRIRSESFDGVTGAPWRAEFFDYFEKRFPKISETLERYETASHSLVYKWKGTGDVESVKPLMIVAHMDVVPVDNGTVDEWVHPPFSGLYDKTWIWGRGSCDDKARLISSLTAVETLLEHGFVPSRTILLALGNDEEVGGNNGAGQIKEYLLETYGPDSMAMIIDEGGQFRDRSGVIFAETAVGEKGYLDIKAEVSTPGGHSSLPPPHTAIGILADLITTLENIPHQAQLFRERNYYQGLHCRAEYDKGFPEDLKELLLQSDSSDEKLRDLEHRLLTFDPMFYALSGTTQAVDLVGGGVKVNSLPESAWATVNHRLADFSTIDALKARFTVLASVVANKHNTSLEAFGRKILDGPVDRKMNLTVPPNKFLVPSPVTPTTGSAPWQLFAGTIRSTFDTQLRTDGLPKTVVNVPVIETSNGDSWHYWDLSKHIFRYGHRGVSDVYNGIHTVNEAIRAEGYLEQIRFFTRLVLNADKSGL